MSLGRISLDAPEEGLAVLAEQPEVAPIAPAMLASALGAHAEPAAALLKALGHEGRLLILCHLAADEKSVSELEALIGQRHSAVSQHLARLRLEGLVTTRRTGKAVHYAIRDQRTIGLLSCLPKLFAEAA